MNLIYLRVSALLLEASVEVPLLAVVKERLLHKETKAKSRSSQQSQAEVRAAKRKFKCHFAISLYTSRKTVRNL